MWGLSEKSIEEKLCQSVQMVMNPNAAFTTYYWGVMDHHYDNFRHRHSFYELCYIVEGTGLYTESNHDVPLQPGSLFLSRPGLDHQIRSQTGLGIVFVAYDLDRHRCHSDVVKHYEHLHTLEGPLIVETADSEVTPSIWRLLCQSVEQQGNSDTIQGLALALLASVPHSFGIQSRLPAQAPASSPLIERAKKLIMDNIGHPLPLTSVAHYFNVSERHLSKCFSLYCGMGYNRWVTHQRIQAALELLAKTDLPIKEISDRTGFSSVHYFTNVFKRYCQTTPAKFRLSHSQPTDVFG